MSHTHIYIYIYTVYTVYVCVWCKVWYDMYDQTSRHNMEMQISWPRTGGQQLLQLFHPWLTKITWLMPHSWHQNHMGLQNNINNVPSPKKNWKTLKHVFFTKFNVNPSMNKAWAVFYWRCTIESIFCIKWSLISFIYMYIICIISHVLYHTLLIIIIIHHYWESTCLINHGSLFGFWHFLLQRAR